VVGISVSGTCGVHAHATLLSDALERDGFSCSSHWLLRRESSLRGVRSEIRAWGAQLERELTETKADVVLFHYSVFSYSFHGVPLFVRPALSHLRRAGLPIVSVMHEFAYPWMFGGRAAAWAVSQRVALIDVMRASAGVLVTAEDRARWLGSRRWLPRRPVALAPVFSNLPAPSAAAGVGQSRRVLGLFGFSYQGAALALVLDALAMLRQAGRGAQLVLLGAPGPASSAGEAWVAAAAARGLSDEVSFSGPMDAQQLSDALAGCDVLLFVDAAGPASRKGTLAGSLASGTPVVAIDGPRRWPELVEAEAVRLVAPEADALAGAIGLLLGDRSQREALGARGRAFAEQRMGIARTVSAVKDLLDAALDGSTRASASGSEAERR